MVCQVIKDAKLTAVIVTSTYTSQVVHPSCPCLTLPQILSCHMADKTAQPSAHLQSMPIDQLQHLPSATAGRVCYVMYTSGSTGSPAGVCGTELGILNRCQWMQRQYPVM